MLVVTAGFILFVLWQIKVKRDKAARLKAITVPVNIQTDLNTAVELQIEADRRRKQDEEDLRRAREQQSNNTDNPENTPEKQPRELNRETIRKLRELEDINRLNRRLKLERELKGLGSEEKK